MWRQRSKSLWLKEGDHNTKYFHHKASQRRRKNSIKEILDERGQWQVEYKRDQVILDYFQNIYSSSVQHDVIGSKLGCLEGLEGRINEEMNQLLIKDFEEQEVFKALQKMHPSKAPGPDVLAPVFFQVYWKTIGKTVTSIVLEALNFGKFPSSINHTFITLIPEKLKPIRVIDYQPVSVCNIVYKLMAKVLRLHSCHDG